MGINDLYWMQQAYAQACLARKSGEVPVGSVLVGPSNELLGTGFNQVIQKRDPTSHAEMVAIRDAAKAIGNYRLIQTTLYVTLEPCYMCAGALVHARISRLVYATADTRVGACSSLFQLFNAKGLNHRIDVETGVLQAPCAALLRDFFKEKRL